MISLAAGILFLSASAAGWLLFGVVVVDELARRLAARGVRRSHVRRQDEGCPL